MDIPRSLNLMDGHGANRNMHTCCVVVAKLNLEGGSNLLEDSMDVVWSFYFLVLRPVASSLIILCPFFFFIIIITIISFLLPS